MRSLSRLTWVEMKLFLREPMLTIITLAFPLMMLLCFGTVYGNKPSDYFGGRGMVDVSVPAWSAIVIAVTAFMSLVVGMASYRERGVLRRMQMTPLRPHMVLVCHVAVLFLMTTLGMALLVVTAKLLYGMRFEGSVLNVAVAFVMGCLAMFALGFVVAGVAPTTRVAQTFGMLLFYPMIFLSGATMPLETMSATLRRYVQVLPLTHVVTLLRGMWVGDGWSQHITEVIVLSTLAVVGVIVSARTFRWE